MKTNITIEQIYMNPSLAGFFFRKQAFETLDLLVNMSTLGVFETISIIDDLTEGQDLDEIEELFYSYGADTIAEDFGIELNEN